MGQSLKQQTQQPHPVMWPDQMRVAKYTTAIKVLLKSEFDQEAAGQVEYKNRGDFPKRLTKKRIGHTKSSNSGKAASRFRRTALYTLSWVLGRF